MRFHSKYHAKNHHTLSSTGYPDSANDPIASKNKPFKGDFHLDGVLYADNLDLSNTLSSLSVDTLTITSFASDTDGSNLINVDADTLDGYNSTAFVFVNDGNVANGYALLDSNGEIFESVIPSPLNNLTVDSLIISSLNFIAVDDYLTEFDLSSTVAPLVTSDNPSGYELPEEYIPVNHHRNYVGFFNYGASDALSSVSLTADTWQIIENDAGGSLTLTSYGPTGLTGIWDENANEFDFSELEVGDMVDIRLNIDVTTTTANQTIRVDMVLAKGTASEFRLSFVPEFIVKSNTTIGITEYEGIYIRNIDTRDNPANFEIITDGSATLNVEGWYCKLTRYTI